MEQEVRLSRSESSRRDSIKIRKYNSVYIQVDAEKSTCRELSDYFTFDVPGASFMPAYRNRYWDGRLDYSMLIQSLSIADLYIT